MNILKKHEFLFCSLCSFLLGFIALYILFGCRVINPFHVDWIINRQIPIDVKETYVGWYYFFHAPWSFPLGLYNTLSYPDYTSILNTDSIPLFAIFFKLFKNILPDDFQYFGIYTLICYMLQSFFGMLLVRKYTKNNIIALLSGFLLCLMPSLAIMSFVLSTLSCHFIILACFIPFVYKFNPKQDILFFTLIGLLGGLITPYILAISGVIIFVYCLYKRQFLPLISFSAVALIALFTTGAFVGIADYTSDVFLEAGCNLNCFFNSYSETFFLNGMKSVSDIQSQGYAYFGLGAYIVIFTCVFHFLRRFIQDKANFKFEKETVYILILIIISLILALSPRITLNEFVLFEIPYPDFIVKFWSMFKMTGRFVWNVNYVVLIMAIIYLVRHFSKKTCIVVLILCSLLQIADLAKLITGKSYLRKENEPIETYYNNSYWNRLYEKNNIKYINFDKHICNDATINMFGRLFSDITIWARDKDIKFNTFYFARPVKKTYGRFKNPTDEDIFIFLKNEYHRKAVGNPALKHFYSIGEIIVARTVEIKGWEEVEITREKAKELAADR